ncbi:MAG: hypothetical protein ACRENE_11770 [Polyangiaceae bacterium]
MSNDWPQGREFWERLMAIDLVRAEQVRREGCRDCGGPLDRSDYPRKPRGELGEAAAAYARRLSFCCRRDGCRHRATPPSVRFLGRKVYVGALVVVASVAGRASLALSRRRTPPIEGVPSRTVRRWLAWWQTVFALGAFWREARGYLATPVAVAELPVSLLARFGKGGAALGKLLDFLAPVTSESVRARISMVV